MMLRKTIWFLVLEIFVTAVISSTIEDRTPTEENLKPVDGKVLSLFFLVIELALVNEGQPSADETLKSNPS